jgi:hypothetical protein
MKENTFKITGLMLRFQIIYYERDLEKENKCLKTDYRALTKS